MCFLIRKRPGLVVGVGGYASGLLVLSAWILRIPILIHEQNSISGMTNKWLGKIADKIAVSFKESSESFPKEKVEVTGNMIREEFCQPKEKALPKTEGPFRVLVLGGSQGSHSINMAMLDALQSLSEQKENLHITHQTGEADFERVSEKYKENNNFSDSTIKPLQCMKMYFFTPKVTKPTIIKTVLSWGAHQLIRNGTYCAY